MALEAPYEITLSGDAVEVANILPDMAQEEFIEHIFFTFAAIPEANNFSKTLSIGLFNDVINNIPNALDWSDKIDNSKKANFDFTKLLSKYASKSLILYAEDGDDSILSQYAAETNEQFGQGTLSIENEHIAKEETIFESKFTPIVNVTSFTNSMYIPRITFLDGAGVRETEPSPKICLITTKIDVEQLSGASATALTINEDGGAGTSVQSDIPFAWMVKTQYIAEVDAYLDSLSFGPSRFPNTIGQTLIDRFLKNYESVLSSAKILKENLLIDETDIANLDFLIPVFLEKYDAYFFKNKIENFKGSEQSTPVELVKIA